MMNTVDKKPNAILPIRFSPAIASCYADAPPLANARVDARCCFLDMCSFSFLAQVRPHYNFSSFRFLLPHCLSFVTISSSIVGNPVTHQQIGSFSCWTAFGKRGVQTP